MKKFIKSAFSRFGYEVARTKPDKYQTLVTICSIAGIGLVYDVGANKGQFASGLRKAGFSGRLVSFEPLPEPFKILDMQAGEDAGWETRNHALGTARGELELLVSGRSGAASSFLRLTPLAKDVANIDVERKIHVQVQTLDDAVLNDAAFSKTHALLKLDVQGFEKSVLDGGKNTVGRFSLILIEASLFRLYENELLAAEMIGHLGSIGFQPIAIFNEFVSPIGVTLQADILFANTKAFIALEEAHHKIHANGQL